jgi:hypothetical protein
MFKTGSRLPPAVYWPHQTPAVTQQKPAGRRTAPPPPPLVWPGLLPRTAQGKLAAPRVSPAPGRPGQAVHAARPSGVVQRQTDVDENTWRLNHQGNIALGSGSDTITVHRHVVNSGITVKIKEKDRNHFCTGHTVREFSFDDENIERSARSSFWPLGMTPSGVLGIADEVLGTLHSEIEEAVGEGSVVSKRAHKHKGVTYTILISVKPKTDSINEFGLYEEGTARLEQFYPTSGTGILGADQADLKQIKKKLGY